MKIFIKLLLFICIFSVFSGCDTKKLYDINTDVVISDLGSRIKALEEDLTSLKTDLDKVRPVLDDTDIAADLRASIRKELHEGEKYIKEIDQWLAYLKIQQKQRYRSLNSRKDSEKLVDEAKIEVEAYLLQKKLKPIVPRWTERYKTAIEL